MSHLWSLHNVQISVPCTSIHVPNVFCFVFCLYFLMLMFFRVCLTLTFLIFVVYSWYFKIWLPSNLLLLKGLVFLWSVIPLGGLSRWGRCRYEGISRVWSKFHGLLISVIQKTLVEKKVMKTSAHAKGSVLIGRKELSPGFQLYFWQECKIIGFILV